MITLIVPWCLDFVFIKQHGRGMYEDKSTGYHFEGTVENYKKGFEVLADQLIVCFICGWQYSR